MTTRPKGFAWVIPVWLHAAPSVRRSGRRRIVGARAQSVKCDPCDNAVTPFEAVRGYTLTFDDTRSAGLTLPKDAAEVIARRADHYPALPDASQQHSIPKHAPSDMPGTLVRMRPFMGQWDPCRCPTATMQAISEPFLSGRRTIMA